MTRIAFTADLHVDSYGSRIQESTGLNARLVDHLNTLELVAGRASDCAALVIAGDFTERRHPAPWLVSLIRAALTSGPERQVYLRGNHDGERAGGSIVTLLDDGFDGFRTGVSRPRLVDIAPDAVLVCIPYLDRHWLRAQPGYESVPDAEVYAVLAAQFLTIARGLWVEAARDYPDAGVVLVCHQTLAGAHLSETQAAFLGDQQLVVSAADLASIGYVGVVAGHLHRHQVLSTDPPVLYAGSIERVDFGEEGEVKGFIVADVGPGRFDWEFSETPARRYVTIDYDAPGWGDAIAAVEGAIVRVLNADPAQDAAQLRRDLEASGAFEVREVRQRPAEQAVVGGLSESLSADEALAAYFADHPERDELVKLGREILAEVAS